jgi:hypothetical protein
MHVCVCVCVCRVRLQGRSVISTEPNPFSAATATAEQAWCSAAAAAACARPASQRASQPASQAHQWPKMSSRRPLRLMPGGSWPARTPRVNKHNSAGARQRAGVGPSRVRAGILDPAHARARARTRARTHAPAALGPASSTTSGAYPHPACTHRPRAPCGSRTTAACRRPRRSTQSTAAHALRRCGERRARPG